MDTPYRNYPYKCASKHKQEQECGSSVYFQAHHHHQLWKIVADSSILSPRFPLAHSDSNGQTHFLVSPLKVKVAHLYSHPIRAKGRSEGTSTLAIASIP